MQKSSRTEVASAIAAVLRERRLAKGLSMSAVAEKAGLSQQIVSYVEREMRSPSLDTLLRLADALDTNLSTLISAAEEKSKRR